MTYSMRPVRRTLQSSHQDIYIVYSVILIRSNNKYELYNPVRGISVCIEIYSDVPMSNLLAASHCLPTEPIHKPVTDKGFFQRYLRIQSRSMQCEKHEGELDRGHAMASERELKRGESVKNELCKIRNEWIRTGLRLSRTGSACGGFQAGELRVTTDNCWVGAEEFWRALSI